MCHVRERSPYYIIRKVMPPGTDEKGQASPRSCYRPEAVCSYVSLPGIVNLSPLPLLTGSGVFSLPGSRRRGTNASSNTSLYATVTILCAMGSDGLLLKSLYPAMYFQAFFTRHKRQRVIYKKAPTKTIRLDITSFSLARASDNMGANYSRVPCSRPAGEVETCS